MPTDGFIVQLLIVRMHELTYTCIIYLKISKQCQKPSVSCSHYNKVSIKNQNIRNIVYIQDYVELRKTPLDIVCWKILDNIKKDDRHLQSIQPTIN